MVQRREGVVVTIKDAIKQLETYPEDQFVHIRVWLKDNRDYLDYGYLDVVVEKIQQSTSGAALVTGTDTREEHI